MEEATETAEPTDTADSTETADSTASTDATEGGDLGPFGGMPPEVAANPQPMYAALRESMPVMVLEGGVALTRRVDIDFALRHPDIFSSGIDAVDLKNIRPMIPLQIDPPHHHKFRTILDPLFAPRQVALLEDDMTTLTNELIDKFIDRGELDFAKEFSVPYPSQVFLTILGLPMDELDTFLAMKDGIIRPNYVTGTDWDSDEANAHQTEAALSVYDYFNEVLDRREADGQDDLLTRFLHTEVDGHRLNREEILDICFLFLIAGLDTVTSTLDCMFSYLAQHPDAREHIVRDPSRIPAAIEELLRWETPVMGVVRVATQDTEIGGCPIAKGAQVMAILGSANTDVEFGDPDTVRFDRETNKHLAFGGGIHRCLGSHLARLELRVALREWHRRIPEYSIAPDTTLEYTGGVRSIDTFPMVLH